MRSVSNFTTGFPNQLGHISDDAGTIAEVLRAEGYVTFCTGKWHLASTNDTSAAGPFDQWPLGRGFDRFYGFLEGETDQFHPELVVDNHHIDPPGTPEKGYHLSQDLVDQLLKMINDKPVHSPRPSVLRLSAVRRRPMRRTRRPRPIWTGTAATTTRVGMTLACAGTSVSSTLASSRRKPRWHRTIRA